MALVVACVVLRGWRPGRPIIGGLYPGNRLELEVTYVNAYSFPIAIGQAAPDASQSVRFGVCAEVTAVQV